MLFRISSHVEDIRNPPVSPLNSVTTVTAAAVDHNYLFLRLLHCVSHKCKLTVRVHLVRSAHVLAVTLLSVPAHVQLQVTDTRI
jgi:hypothetical protein